MSDIQKVADTQCRKWQITINNPIEKGFTHERIKELLKEFKSCLYWCLSDETGEQGTYHTHIFLSCSSAVRFSTVKSKFDAGHIEPAKGTAQQNKDYVFKQGKWEGDKKQGTNHPDTHEEWGEMPIERQGKRNDLDDLYDMIKAGLTNYEILEDSPQYMMAIDKVEKCRQVIQAEKYKNEWRELNVTYIYGHTGMGKTRSVMEKYGYSNVYRVSDYVHPFDGYEGQDILLLDEFRSGNGNLTMSDMLDILDGYPLVLRCRYANKQACFTKVYIISNLDLHSQYVGVQKEDLRTWQAFLRRIHTVKVFTEDGQIHEMPCKTYMNGFVPVTSKDDTVFKLE